MLTTCRLFSTCGLATTGLGFCISFTELADFNTGGGGGAAFFLRPATVVLFKQIEKNQRILLFIITDKTVIFSETI